MQQFTGGNIVKVTVTGSNQTRSLATNGFLTISTLFPAGGLYGTSSGPATQVNRYTNYSGTSPTFGNVVAMASGAGNVLYAALARSFVASDDLATQSTEGLFASPFGPAPSMIISFADCARRFRRVHGRRGHGRAADRGWHCRRGSAESGLNAGINNFRVFALGDGPDLRQPTGFVSPVFGTVDSHAADAVPGGLHDLLRPHRRRRRIRCISCPGARPWPSAAIHRRISARSWYFPMPRPPTAVPTTSTARVTRCPTRRSSERGRRRVQSVRPHLLGRTDGPDHRVPGGHSRIVAWLPHVSQSHANGGSYADASERAGPR